MADTPESESADRGPDEPPAVSVRGLVKRHPRSGRLPAGRLLAELGRAVLGRPAPESPDAGEFAAVDGLSLEVRRGEALALIGRNGCGKTTTLKVIAGLIRPDAGEVEVRGRVQALIALGAGFNNELSGAENVVNNAAVMGLSAKQAQRVLHRAIAFAELADFIHAPVGTYSSGMRARLGFAVAVHLKPDVLLLDEILGVGDLAFQAKCFRRLKRLRRAGVTILLVSHSLDQVGKLCDRAVWLDHGRPVREGPAGEVVAAYRAAQRPATSKPGAAPGAAVAKPPPPRPAPPSPRRSPHGPRIPAASGLRDPWVDAPPVEAGAEARLRFGVTLDKPLEAFNLSVELHSLGGVVVAELSTAADASLASRGASRGPQAFEASWPAGRLVPGWWAVFLVAHEAGACRFRDGLGVLVVGGDPPPRGLIGLGATMRRVEAAQ